MWINHIQGRAMIRTKKKNPTLVTSTKLENANMESKVKTVVLNIQTSAKSSCSWDSKNMTKKVVTHPAHLHAFKLLFKTVINIKVTLLKITVNKTYYYYYYYY